jgi:hypothetical protein
MGLDPVLDNAQCFIASLDAEVRAFIHISGIELRENHYGGVKPILCYNGWDVAVALYPGDPRTLEYWRKIAERAWSCMPLRQ